MKTQLLTCLIAATLVGCNTKKSTTSESESSLPTGSESGTASESQAQCYALTTASDTVRLNITRQGDAVTGTLLYQLAGKDKNTGTLSGKMRGDTLLADYTFQSEGQESVRQVAFLAKDGGFAEGYGPVQEQAGKMMFTPNAPLTFESNRVLTKATCP